MDLLWLYYLIVNLFLFLWMAWDKHQAKAGGRRVPEKHLLTLALLGGALGGCLGMTVFRHKTRKLSVKLVFALGIILHLALLWYVSFKLQ